MSSLDVDIEIKPFEQLEHASVGYQSLTDVPQTIAYAEDHVNFKVCVLLFQRREKTLIILEKIGNHIHVNVIFIITLGI